MKVLFWVWSSLILASITHGDPIASFTPKSVIFLVKSADVSQKSKIYRSFRALKCSEFQEESMHFLVKNISIETKLLALFAKRKIAPFNYLVRIDLRKEFTPRQLDSLRKVKKYLQSLPHSVVIALLTTNYPFYRVEGSENKDIAMAFINQWPVDKSRVEAQRYWLEHHGPLVLKLGLPPVIRSYTQVHTDIENLEGGLFDQTYQGFSFETITSQGQLFKTFLENPKLRRLNQELEKDEENFTPPPPLFTFKALRME